MKISALGVKPVSPPLKIRLYLTKLCLLYDLVEYDMGHDFFTKTFTDRTDRLVVQYGVELKEYKNEIPDKNEVHYKFEYHHGKLHYINKRI